MKNQNQSRRNFLKTSGAAVSGSWLSLNVPLVLAVAQTACGRRESAPESWANITASEAGGLGAVADQIIPPDETPGAVDAGVIHFLDAAMAGFMAGTLPMLREGLAGLDERAAGSFAELEFGQQTQLLEEIEDTPFFQTMQFITMVGMFAMSKYGGNRDHAGWELIGFDHRHAWQPPFGYYDELNSAAGGAHEQP